MTDATSTSTTAAPETPLPNSPEARTPTGELKDAQTPPSTPPTEGGTSPTTPEAAPEPPKAPETYAAFRAPENYKLDEELIATVTPMFKEMNLSQDQAQKLVDFYSKNAIATGEQLTKAVTDMKAEWAAQIEKSPDLGGARSDQVRATIARALGQLPKEIETKFRDALTFTGAGIHPDVVRGVWKLAELLTEGQHVPGGNPSPLGMTPNGRAQRPSAAEALYPNLPHG